MVAPSFDPTHTIRFDLPHGSVRAGGDGDHVLLLPCAALDALVLSAPMEAVEGLGRAFGMAIGRRAAARLEDPKSASMEAFVTELAGVGAVTGVGVMSIERWGRALVVVIENSPLAGTLLAPLVASAIEAAFGRKVWSTLLGRDEHTARVLVTSERAAGRVRDAIASGTPWGQALAMLHGGKV
jgi:hypothetical protein